MFKKYVQSSGLFAFISLLAVVAQANAATVYVNPTSGSDNNPGTQAAPFKTITKAVSINAVSEIDLAFGNYSSSSGEKFGWDFKPASGSVRIVGIGITASVIDVAGQFNCIRQTGKANIIFEAVSIKSCTVTTSGVAGTSLTFQNTYLENIQEFSNSQSHISVDASSIAGSSGFFVANGTTLDFRNTDVDGTNQGLFAFVSLDNSTLYADGLVVHDMVTSTVVIDVTNQSSAEIYNSEFRDSWGTLSGVGDALGSVDGQAIAGVTIRVTEQSRVVDNGSTLRSTNTTINGSAGIGIYGDYGTTIKVNGGSYTGNQIGIFADDATSLLNNDLNLASRAVFNNTLANWIVYGDTAIAVLDNGSFRGGKYGIQSFNNGVISVSNSAFDKISRPIQFESIDSRQSQIALGQNLTFRGNAVNYSSIVATCVEPVTLAVSSNTTWRPNIQGADSSGHIPPQVIKGVKKGNNYWLKNSNCRLNVL